MTQTLFPDILGSLVTKTMFMTLLLVMMPSNYNKRKSVIFFILVALFQIAVSIYFYRVRDYTNLARLGRIHQVATPCIDGRVLKSFLPALAAVPSAGGGGVPGEMDWHSRKTRVKIKFKSKQKKTADECRFFMVFLNQGFSESLGSCFPGGTLGFLLFCRERVFLSQKTPST